MLHIVGVYSHTLNFPEAVTNCFYGRHDLYDVKPFIFTEVSAIKRGAHQDLQHLDFNDDDVWVVCCLEMDKADIAKFIESPHLDPAYDLDICGF